jgi:hypothetical protein
MWIQILLVSCTFGFWFQGKVTPAISAGSECLSAVEKTRLAAESKIDNRIKLYQQVSERFHRAVTNAVKKQDYDEGLGRIQCWRELLSASLKDIEANVNRKKKSGALIRYEIQLRKAIVDMGNTKLRIPYQQQADFESWIGQAEATRGRFVDILFQR